MALFVCVNPECGEHGYVVETDTFKDMGGTFLCDEDVTTCDECGWYRADPERPYGLDIVCVRKDFYVLVDARNATTPEIIGHGSHAAMTAVQDLTINHRRRKAA